MANNPYAPPRADVVTAGTTGKGINGLARISIYVGLLSGLVLAAAPWIFGVSTQSSAGYVMPAFWGLLVSAAHWFTLRRLREPAGESWPVLLLVANVLLSSLFVAGIFFVLGRRAGDPLLPWIVAGFLLIWIAPLTLNVVYLVTAALSRTRSGGH